METIEAPDVLCVPIDWLVELVVPSGLAEMELLPLEGGEDGVVKPPIVELADPDALPVAEPLSEPEPELEIEPDEGDVEPEFEEPNCPLLEFWAAVLLG